MRLQQQLAILSPHGRLVLAQDCGHDVQTDCPQVVIEAIRQMVKETTAR